MGKFRKFIKKGKKILRQIRPSQLIRPLIIPKIKRQITQQLNRAMDEAKILLTQQKEKDLQAVKQLIDNKIHQWNLEIVELDKQLAENKITNDQLNQVRVWIILALLDCKHGTDDYLSELFDLSGSDVVDADYIIKKYAIEFLFTSELCPLQVAYENLSSHHCLEAITQILPFYCDAEFDSGPVNQAYYQKIKSIIERRIGESLAISDSTYSEYDYILAGLTELNEDHLCKWQGKCHFELMSETPNNLNSEQISNGQLVVYEKNEDDWTIHYPADLPAYPVFLQHAKALPLLKGLSTGIYLYRSANTQVVYALVVHPAIYNRYEILNLTESGISVAHVVFPEGGNILYDADPALVSNIMDACKGRYFEHRHLKLEQMSDCDTALSAALKQGKKVRISHSHIPSRLLEITSRLISTLITLAPDKTSPYFGTTISYGESLEPGQYLVDDNALYRFVVEPDGRGVVYERLPTNSARILFSSPKIAAGQAYRFSITSDGNIEISNERTSWTSQWQSITCEPAICSMQGDGHLVVYGTHNQQLTPLYRSGVCYPLLHSFTKFGDAFVANMKNIIARDGNSVNSADFSGHLPLDYALSWGHVEAAKLIISEGGRLGRLPRHRSRHVVALSDDAVCILVNDRLITGFNLETNQWVDVIKVNDEHDSKLQSDGSFSVQTLFVNENQFHKIKAYLQENDSDLETKLCDATRVGDIQACHLFLLLGADVNVQYANRSDALKTPLMLAISETNNPALVSLLLKGKADCRLKTNDAHQTAWHCAFEAFNRFSSSSTAIEIIEIMSAYDDGSITDLKNAAGKSPQEMVAINAITMPMRLALRKTLPDLNHDKCFALPLEFFKQKLPDCNESELTTPQWWQALLHYLEIQKGMGQGHLCKQVGGCAVYFKPELPSELKDYHGHYIIIEGQRQLFYIASAEGQEIAQPVAVGDFDKLLQDIRRKQLPVVTQMVPLTYAQQASLFSGVNQHRRSTNPTDNATLLGDFYKIYKLIPAFNQGSHLGEQRLQELLNGLIEGHAACTTGYQTRVHTALEQACGIVPRNIQELLYSYRKKFGEKVYAAAAKTYKPVEHRPTDEVFEIHDQGLFWSFTALGLNVPGTVSGESPLIHRFFYKRNVAKLLLDNLHEQFRPWSLANALTGLFKEGFESYSGYQGIRPSDLNKFQCYLMPEGTPDKSQQAGSIFLYREDKEIHALVTHLDGRFEVIKVASKADYFTSLLDRVADGESLDAMPGSWDNGALEAIVEHCKSYFDKGEYDKFTKRFVSRFMWLFPDKESTDAEVMRQLYGDDMEITDDPNRIFVIEKGFKIRDFNWNYVASLMLEYLIKNDYFDEAGKPFINIQYVHSIFPARHVDDVVDYYANGHVSAKDYDAFLLACSDALPDKEELLGKLLLASIASDDAEMRGLLIAKGANINFARPFNKAPALAVESYYQFIEKIVYKIESKIAQPVPPAQPKAGSSAPVFDPYNEWVAKLNLQWFDERTPLMMAVTQGKIAVVLALLDAGAEVNYQNTHGWTALHEAAFLSRRHPEIAMDMLEVLILHGADTSLAAQAYGKPVGHKTILPIHVTWPETEAFEFLILNTDVSLPGPDSAARSRVAESLPAVMPKEITISHQNAILPYMVLAARLIQGNLNFPSAILSAKACHASFTTRLPRAFYHRQIGVDQPINPSGKKPGLYFYPDNQNEKTWILIVHDRSRYEIHELNTLIPDAKASYPFESSAVKTMPAPIKKEIQNTWATDEGIHQALISCLGDMAHIIEPGLSSVATPLSDSDGIKAYADRIAGYIDSEGVVHTNGFIHDDGGVLRKPVVMVINTQTAQATSRTDVEATGGTHWVACVILPKSYAISGQTFSHPTERIFFVDALQQTPFPIDFLNALKYGIAFDGMREPGSEELAANPELSPTSTIQYTHLIEAPFPQSELIHLNQFVQQSGGSDCGWWAVYNSIMLVLTGGDMFMQRFAPPAQPERAYGLRQLFPDLDRDNLMGSGVNKIALAGLAGKLQDLYNQPAIDASTTWEVSKNPSRKNEIWHHELCSDENAMTILSNCHYPFSMPLNRHGKLATTLWQLFNSTLFIFSEETFFYSDVPLKDRLTSDKYREIFQLAAGYINSISGIPNRWKIALLTAFQAMSHEAFIAGDFATAQQLSAFHREAVSCIGHEFSNAVVPAILNKLKENCIKNRDHAIQIGESIYQQIESQYQELLLQVQSSLEAQFRQAKNKAVKNALRKMDLAICGVAITAALAPMISSAIVANLGIAAGSAAAAGGTAGAVNLTVVAINAISTAIVGCTSQALLNRDYKHLPENIAKDFALNFVPAAATCKLNLNTQKILVLKASIREGLRSVLDRDKHILQSALAGGFGTAFGESLSEVIRPELMKVFDNNLIVNAFESALVSSLRNVSVTIARRRKLSMQDMLIGALTDAFQTFLGECIAKNIVIVADPLNGEKNLDQVDSRVRRRGVVSENLTDKKHRDTPQAQTSGKQSQKTVPVVLSDVQHSARRDNNEKPGQQGKTLTGRFFPRGKSATQHFFDMYDKGKVVVPTKINRNQPVALRGTGAHPQGHLGGLNTKPVTKMENLPVCLPTDVDALERRMYLRIAGGKSHPVIRLFFDLSAEFKSHDSMAQYLLDGLMMYRPTRCLEGLALIGDYSKDNDLHKKSFQAWGTKLKSRDLFADDSYRAGIGWVFFEHLAAGLHAINDYSAAQFNERVEQLHMLMKFVLTSPTPPKFIFGIPQIPVTPATSLSMMPAERVPDGLIQSLPGGIALAGAALAGSTVNQTRKLTPAEIMNFRLNMKQRMQADWLSMNQLADKMFPAATKGLANSRSSLRRPLWEQTKTGTLSWKFVNTVARGLGCSPEALLESPLPGRLSLTGEAFIKEAQNGKALQTSSIHKVSHKISVPVERLRAVVNYGSGRFTEAEILSLHALGFKLPTLAPFAAETVDMIRVTNKLGDKVFAGPLPRMSLDRQHWAYQRKALNIIMYERGISAAELSRQTQLPLSFLKERIVWAQGYSKASNVIIPPAKEWNTVLSHLNLTNRSHELGMMGKYSLSIKQTEELIQCEKIFREYAKNLAAGSKIPAISEKELYQFYLSMKHQWFSATSHLTRDTIVNTIRNIGWGKTIVFTSAFLTSLVKSVPLTAAEITADYGVQYYDDARLHTNNRLNQIVYAVNSHVLKMLFLIPRGLGAAATTPFPSESNLFLSLLKLPVDMLRRFVEADGYSRAIVDDWQKVLERVLPAPFEHVPVSRVSEDLPEKTVKLFDLNEHTNRNRFFSRDVSNTSRFGKLPGNSAAKEIFCNSPGCG